MWRARKRVGCWAYEGVDDGSGLVGGAVVDGEDLEVGVVLVEEGVEGGGDVGGFVAGRDDDGEGWVG
ncbi:MAG: hypothetical protein WDN23_15015 [Edaphobacter sp.]